jgi:hypothetical protein
VLLNSPPCHSPDKQTDIAERRPIDRRELAIGLPCGMSDTDLSDLLLSQRTGWVTSPPLIHVVDIVDGSSRPKMVRSHTTTDIATVKNVHTGRDWPHVQFVRHAVCRQELTRPTPRSDLAVAILCQSTNPQPATVIRLSDLRPEAFLQWGERSRHNRVLLHPQPRRGGSACQT